MAINLETVKNVIPNKNLFKKIAAVTFSILVFVVSFMVINNANQAAKDTVSVLRVKTEDGIPARSVITEDDIEEYNLIRKEFSEDMVRVENKEKIINKFTKYYLRNSSVLFKDQLLDEKPLKNEWLYELDTEHEVVTIPYNYLEAGGDILTPGDRVRIRVSYEVEGGGGVSGNPNVMTYATSNKTMRTEVLFDSIVVKDMLNANSHSIYEVYKEVMKLPENQKQEVMKSEDFLENIKPKSLVLEGTRDQINNYAKYKSLEGKSFLITILQRQEGNIVLDQLPTLEKEVESWIEKEQK
ncbi:MAG: flagellar biosynthesis protein FlgA [Clostridia bacterium]|nr:flagellar biosynthesis protein FlgA [Clostridia bacterium]